VKMLHDRDFNDKRTFENEAKQLRRFGGLVHDHLVTLLATYILNKRFCFIFPYAEYNLEHYWESKEPNPRMDAVTVRWVSKQCAGIMAAIHTMHEPKHLRNLDVPRFCRHGDIKPDNILWFRSPNDPRGILVVSDMGLSSFNRITSRSNIPNADLPVFPTYRPPECDVKGGSVSRLFDVWTLGCLFLDLLTWLLGGPDLVEDFSESRVSLYIHGTDNDMFFEHKRLPGSNTQIIQVKETVTKVSLF
jgi:serine/threonine protein kinase